MPLKPHDKTLLHEVPGRMRRHHCDERPPRPARRAGHCYGEHKRVREGISGFFDKLEFIFAGQDFTKAQVIEAIKEFILNFEHEEKGKNLNLKNSFGYG